MHTSKPTGIIKRMEKTYWFKRRRYGWGWFPASWQGWVIVGAYLALILGGAFYFEDSASDNTSEEMTIYLTMVLAASALLLYLSHRFGPPPKWRWGKSAEDNPAEDI